MRRVLRIGTRGSALAMRQAQWIGSALQRRFEGLQIELIKIKTSGDKIQDVPLAKIGGKGLFIKEIEDALLLNRIDLAVHSLKDVPAELPQGLGITAICEREDPRDALISKDGRDFSNLHRGARVGTCSLRRTAQILHHRPDIEVVPLRGNLDTRIKKLQQGKLDAIVVALAGLRRMGQEKTASEIFSIETLLPAVGQGALALETRDTDDEIKTVASALDHSETRLSVEAERSFLKRLEGGCQVPIGGYAYVRRNTLHLEGMVADVRGEKPIRERIKGPPVHGEDIGTRLADIILEKGGGEILRSVYEAQTNHFL